uniref:Cellulose synthase operon C C-terminal domain-containing protein n=1 Tax=mine drainage metagenome TaxID=410659 RepID=E6QIZ1_9ZZZZ
MDTRLKTGKLLGRALWVAALLVGCAPAPVYAQNVSNTEKILVQKAQSLEDRGRPDLAAQVWQQILLSDPNNTQALAGMARSFRLSGNSKESEAAIEKLRKMNPNDPNIHKIEGLTSDRARNERLALAGSLAKAGNADAAMKIYREYYDDHPPDGDIALAYYDTLYATPNGHDAAIAGMRAMADRNPGDPRFAVELGRMLTYDAKTRAEGIRILREHQKDDDAGPALRQALIWDSANPSSAAQLREYLKEHPQDIELAGKLRQNEAELAEMNSGIARTPAERAAFAALNAHRLEEAQARFQALLDQNPKNPRAAVGMGFLRMQQSNFGGAVSYLTQAEENGYKTASVTRALATSRFWYTMGEASDAIKANELDLAQEKYLAALAMRPKSPEALNGLAGLYLKEQKYPAAASTYQTLLKLQPRSNDAWRGLFLADAQSNQTNAALAVMNRFPATVRTALNRDPGFLQTLANIYQAQGRDAEAQSALARALALPFPTGDATLRAGTQLQYAGLLVATRHYQQAAALYTRILNDDSGNLSAWMGLVSADHQMGQDQAAIHLVERMPPTTYDSALADPGFLSMLASIYQQANQLEIAQSLLERSVRLQNQAGGHPPVAIETQLAGLYLQRGNDQQAFALYRQILMAHPDSIDAWQGLIGTLQNTNRNAEALQQIQLIPTAVRRRLEQNVQFVQSEASLYASAGNATQASAYFNRVRAYYQARHLPLPANAEIQNAYLLFSAKNDRALYPELMQLGSRQDLTLDQRKTVQGLWANWAARRAAADAARGDTRAATELLDATAQAFPNNPDVLKTVASGYVTAGQTREALSLFKSLGMENATAGDYQGAIGAALAANDRAQAETWLREALDRYPHDPGILGAAARFEQVRGDNARAADYWRASIQAMPPVTPTDTLAHKLDQPEQSTREWKATTPRQLASLLDPGNLADQPFQNTIELPPLPSYGHDPYDGSAPVSLSRRNSGTASQSGQSVMPAIPQAITQQAPTEDFQSQRMAVAPAIPAPEAEANSSTADDTGVIDGTNTTNNHGSAEAPNTSPAPSSETAPRRRAKKKIPTMRDSPASGYQGQMRLPAGGAPVTSTMPDNTIQQDSDPGNSGQQNTIPQYQPGASQAAPYIPPTSAPVAPNPPADNYQASPLLTEPQASLPDSRSLPGEGLRITAQPMGALAARTQAMMAEQTDGQLTEGLAIQYVPNAANQNSAYASTGGGQSPDAAQLEYRSAQYTPSAQDAAAAAYSARLRQKEQQPAPAQQPQQAVPDHPQRRRRRTAVAAQQPASATAPDNTPLPEQMPAPQQDTQPDAQYQAPTGLTDEQLQQRNLPPLRGSWVRVKRAPRVLSPREEAEMQLRSIEGGYSGWLGGTGILNYRTGQPGFDAMTALDASFEISAPLGQAARFTLIGTPVFLDSGQATGNSVSQLSTLNGVTVGLQAEPLGTILTTNTNVPNQQNAAGIGGEAQLAFSTFAVAAGYTPYGFPVSNITGRLFWRPRNGPLNFNFSRDSIKDSQLSYAGMRDPGSATQVFPGNIWGGVIANQGTLQYARGDLISGFYAGLGGQYITGHHVLTNHRIDGSLGAYWRVWLSPEYGSLNVGANFFAMSYANNQLGYTYGLGGYFSPQSYFLANIPLTFSGHYLTRWHYTILGSLGIQAFNNNQAQLFPLDKSLEVGSTVTVGTKAVGNLAIPALTSVGPNYDLVGQTAYQISDHWFAGGFLTANNSRNYASVSAGFSIHYMFRSQPSTVAGPTGLFPYDDQHALRPLLVP